MLRVTNASVWEGKDTWGCEYVFVQNGFHESHQRSMELIQIGPECCDKCLTNCPEFRLKIEGCAIKDFKIDYNITQFCTAPQIDRVKVTQSVPTLRETTTTQITLEPMAPIITKIGPYTVKKAGIQKLLINPKWSLKQVEMAMQVNASTIQPECAPFLRTSFMDWTTWLQKCMPYMSRQKKDLTGLLRLGLGVLNTIDSEILMNKLTAFGGNMVKLQQPLQSSLLALGTSQWKFSKILPEWENMEE